MVLQIPTDESMGISEPASLLSIVCQKKAGRFQAAATHYDDTRMHRDAVTVEATGNDSIHSSAAVIEGELGDVRVEKQHDVSTCTNRVSI